MIRQIMAYPLSEFDGTMRETDWASIHVLPWKKLSNEEWRWVNPASFFDSLPKALELCPPLPGEEAIYALPRSVLAAADDDRDLREALREAAEEADESLVRPLLEFRNFGVPLPHNWTTVVNSAGFGTDYYTRTAVAKSNIFINRPRETRYFYQDLDAKGARLNGAAGRYSVTFQEVPPVNGFWSITLYYKYHFLAPNEIDRFSLGTKSDQLRYETDGSLVIQVQKERQAKTKSRTGCRRRTMSSRCISGLIGRSGRSWRGAGLRRPSSRLSVPSGALLPLLSPTGRGGRLLIRDRQTRGLPASCCKS
jgi:hypothetical protein